MATNNGSLTLPIDDGSRRTSLRVNLEGVPGLELKVDLSALSDKQLAALQAFLDLAPMACTLIGEAKGYQPPPPPPLPKKAPPAPGNAPKKREKKPKKKTSSP